MIHDTNCAAVRPLLFVGLESELDRAERLRIEAHLAVCADCRSFERAERALTELLDPRAMATAATAAQAPRRWSRARAGTLAAAAAAAALLLFVLPAATPHGSIIERQLGPQMAWEVQWAGALERSNHISLPGTSSVSIDLADGVQIEATGPVRFVLDLVDDQWQLVMLAGRVRATTTEPGALVVINLGGRSPLAAGRHLLTPDSVEPQDGKARKQNDAVSLIAEGQSLFFKERPAAHGGDATAEATNMAAAEKLFRRVLELPGVATEHSNTALFYVGNCLSRRDRHREAIAARTRWLALYPDGGKRSTVLFFMAHSHEQLGEHAQTRRIREQIINEDPDSQMAGHARDYLRARAAGPVPQRTPATRPAGGALSAKLSRTAAASGPYLVVPIDLRKGRAADADYLAAAESARAFHSGVMEPWGGDDMEQLATLLRRHRPANVLFVLQPGTLDIRLHRAILLRSAAVDDDIFVDFAFGYLTARTGDGIRALWRRIEQVHRNGLSSKRWVQTSVTSGAKSFEYANTRPPVALHLGFTGPHIYFSTTDPRRMEFVDAHLPRLEDAAVIQMTGNGDPQGIWLFPDRRNLDRSKHWPYAKDKVGYDPEGVMTRITAERFRRLQLASPIVWSGTCHSAATCRVFVEGDIVSTFGRTDVTTVHELKPERSLALALLDAGAVALLAPIAANHGMSVMMETEFVLRWGASLGETVKSTYDDVFLAAEGRLVLDLPNEGEPHGHKEYVMQGGGANRVLLGDPALRPFSAARGFIDEVSVVQHTGGFRVTVDRAAGFPPRGWDIYGRSRPDDWRVLVRVDLEDYTKQDRDLELTPRVTATDPDGAVMPYRLTRCFAETYDGRRYLHLQANAPRAAVERKAARVVFEVDVR